MNISDTERARRRKVVNRVRRLAEQNGVGRVELAELIGVTKSMVNTYFRKGSGVVPAGTNFDAFIAAESLLRETNGKPGSLANVKRGIKAAHEAPIGVPAFGVSVRVGEVDVIWDAASRTVTLKSEGPFNVHIA